MNDTITVRGELARTGLLNVQHWFDHGAELLSHGHLGDWQTIVIMAERHLIAVNAALRDGVASAPVAPQLDATIKAMNEFWYAALAWCSRQRVRMDRTLERAMDRIYEKIDQARLLLCHSAPLGSPAEMIELTHARASQVDDVYEAMALDPVLALMRHEAEQALVELGGKDAHVVEIVERVTRSLELRCDHAQFLLESYEGNERTFAPLLDLAIIAVDRLQKAIAERVRVFQSERFDRVIVRMTSFSITRAAA
jgi:hypothetical protein